MSVEFGDCHFSPFSLSSCLSAEEVEIYLSFIALAKEDFRISLSFLTDVRIITDIQILLFKHFLVLFSFGNKLLDSFCPVGPTVFLNILHGLRGNFFG